MAFVGMVLVVGVWLDWGLLFLINVGCCIGLFGWLLAFQQGLFAALAAVVLVGIVGSFNMSITASGAFPEQPRLVSGGVAASVSIALTCWGSSVKRVVTISCHGS